MRRAHGRLADADLFAHIEGTIPDFHAARLASLGRLKLRDLLRSKNPYLFRAKNVLIAPELVQGFMAAHLSSQEEGIFGTFLEKLAIYVATTLWGGQKSPAEGVDLDLMIRRQRYLITIKSGPDWGNSSQIARMRDNFKRARQVLRTNATAKAIICVNGCCYGRVANENKGDYVKLAGQAFWHFLSGDADLYRRIIVPIGYRAKERNEQFAAEYAKVLNRFCEEFISGFCHKDGSIDWDKLLAFNSAKA
ncbi:MAG: PmeII family type II restriction endonuclease [Chthoniobacterales bacterium]